MRHRLTIALVLLVAPFGGHPAAAQLPYRDAPLPVVERVRDLVGRMTLEEKFWQRFMLPGDLDDPSHDYSHGVFGLQVRLPSGARASAHETRGRGIRQVLSPVINLANDVRWGRVEESCGEDPLLTSPMGRAFVAGFEEAGLVATPKHFVANVGEGGRDSYPIDIDQRLLMENFFPPFRAAIEAGHARSVMTAFNGGLDVVYQSSWPEHRPYLEAFRRGMIADTVINAAVSQPVTRLAAFTRITLAPGEEREVSFTHCPEQLHLLDRQLRWVVEPGAFRVMVGASSRDIRLRGALVVK